MLSTTLSSLDFLAYFASVVLSGLPDFLAYFALAVFLVLVFVRIYTWITPQDELSLIRANNTAAALTFGGALIGFALPLASAITHSMSLLDCAVWGVVALIVQVLNFLSVHFIFKQLPQRIAQGEIATGIFVAATAIAVGMINAACMTY